MEATVQSPAGPIEPIPDLKRRATATYWRPYTKEDGSTEWIATRPLPADMEGKELYLNKGFRLTPPAKETSALVKEVDLDKEALATENALLRVQLEQLKKSKAKHPKKN